MAASITDLLTAHQNAVSGINSVWQSAPKFSSMLVGSIYAFNNLSTAAVVVLTSASSRTSIIFHNPSDGVTAFVFPTASSSGAALSVTSDSSTRGGSFVLLPQDYIFFSGNCAYEWRAISSSGSGNPLTITIT